MSHSGAYASSSLGRLSRLSRLGKREATHLLAMDHAVTEGLYPGQDMPQDIVRACIAEGISGVVCHRGFLRVISGDSPPPVFLQIYGSQVLGQAKVQLLDPEIALTLDCVGVAVELDTEGESKVLASAFNVVEHSQRLGLLTLVMASFKGDNATAFARGVTVASQTGADFIKTRLPPGIDVARHASVLEQAVQNAPPLLLAGGPRDQPLADNLRVAQGLRFSGTCIGRNYFWREDRSKNIDLVRRSFSTAH